MASVPPAKRARKSAAKAREYDFCVKFSSPSSLKCACESIGNLLIDANFIVKKTTDGFTGLSIDMLNPALVGAVKFRYSAPIETPEDDPILTSFCVNMKKFILVVREVPSTALFEIVRYKGSEDRISLRWTTEQGTSQFELPTLEFDGEPAPMLSIDHKFTIQLAVEKLKSFITIAGKLKAEEMWIDISEIPGAPGNRFFSFGFENDEGLKGTNRYHSITQTTDEGEEIITCGEEVTVDHSTDTRESLYHECFSTHYLHNFLRGMEKTDLTIALGYEQTEDGKAGESLPMVVHSNIGVDATSYIRLVLAPNGEEEE